MGTLGHADILREGLDGRTGSFAHYERPIDVPARAAYRAKIEQAARTTATDDTGQHGRVAP